MSINSIEFKKKNNRFFVLNELDTSKGLRFSLVRYNRDNPIVFSLYRIPKDFEIPTREIAEKRQPWLSPNFQLPDNSISLSFRGCVSSVQSAAGMLQLLGLSPIINWFCTRSCTGKLGAQKQRAQKLIPTKIPLMT